MASITIITGAAPRSETMAMIGSPILLDSTDLTDVPIARCYHRGQAHHGKTHRR
jgi:hypothetical protein